MNLIWDNINISTYLEIQEIIATKSKAKAQLELLDLLYEGKENLMELSLGELTKLFDSNIRPLLEKPFIPKNQGTINGFKPKPFSALSLAEWIDFDTYLSKRDYVEIIALILRRTRKDEWGNTEFEPYTYDLDERTIQISNLPALDTYSIILNSINYRNDVLDSYKDVLRSSDVELTKEEKEELGNDARMVEEELKKEETKSKYSWHKLLDDISGGNWSYSKDILKLNHLYLFNMIRMQKIFKPKNK